MSLMDRTPDAYLDPWLLFELHDGLEILFGYAANQPVTGGFSWMHSTPVEEVDEKAGRARTASGRLYLLGRRVTIERLNEEGSAAFELLILKPGGFLVPDPVADLLTGEWLAARKWARHLQVPPLPRDEPLAVRRFLDSHAEGVLLHPRRQPAELTTARFRAHWQVETGTAGRFSGLGRVSG
jgi:hypothetical protein